MDISKLPPNAQRTLAEATQLFQQSGKAELQDVAFQRGGYRLLYVATQGCGGSIHNFNNMRRADALPGVELQYLQGDATPMSQWRGERPAGQRLGGFYDDNSRPATQAARRYGISIFETDVFLIGPNDRVIGRFNSTDHDFVNNNARATGQQPQQAPQRGRSH